MSKIVNQAAHTDNDKINALRDAFGHRAMWLYFLVSEMRKAGVEGWKDIAYRATFRCGCFQGEGFKELIDGEDLSAFETEFAEPNGHGRKIFEMEEVHKDSEHYYLDFHYCPLVEAWQKLGCTDEEIDVLCDIAMNGDRGIASVFDDFVFTLGRTIAQGHSCCEIRFDKKKG